MLEGKVALITGSTRNNGYGMAALFSSLGADVYINGPTAAEAEKAARSLTDSVKTGRRFFPLPADVSEEAEVVAMLETVRRSTGRLDILVNNACHLGLGHRFLDTPADFFDAVLAVNVRGYFLCAREAGRLMRETGTRGAIVQIGSVTASRVLRDRIAYIASKGAIESMTKAMAVELADYGIRVNAVLPGYIHTERWEEMPAEVAEARRANVPLGVEAYPEDVGNAVAFLASDRARTITGAILPVTGGKDVQMLPRFLELESRRPEDDAR